MKTQSVVSARGRELLDYLTGQRPAMLRLLEELVRAESPSREPESQQEVQRILTAELESLGFRVRRAPGVESGGLLLAAPRQRRKRRPLQVLVGHCDTVWPRGTLATMPITLRRGKLSGPGVFDMKGGLALLVFALKALKKLAVEPQVTPVVLINSDEEIGSRESRRAIGRLARVADRVLVLEPALGTRGRLKTARKGVGQFTLRVRGKAAHAGLEPAKGVSAILELSHLVQKLFALNDPKAGITVNVGTIDGGMRPNVVAPEGRAVVDVRVIDREQARSVEEAIFALRPVTPGAQLEIEGGVDLPPMERTPRNQALWRMARELGRELGLELQQSLAGGGSDGNVASLFAPTLDGLGPVGGGAHAAHEHVRFDSLVERGALLAMLIAAPALAWSGNEDPAPGRVETGGGRDVDRSRK